MTLYSLSDVVYWSNLSCCHTHQGLSCCKKGQYSSSWEPYLRATGRHLPYAAAMHTHYTVSSYLFHKNLPSSYHTVLPALRHKWRRPA